ncbi:1,2-phenylacetyl-CoA epoxidase subunit PaaD [Rhabdaerophilum sp. SD176]|uniref:1,2-phenylacetyl-CoA epoxidase subunit PaaD n=1 Tax=Rhabdaerophilum sp. SD176 TaxID=2983548 RepID=UPI0024DF3DD1|nr:1,2-phenylacetyl-CoA epoxidase subunit PaaD [Rhabdaerophilum sp. SD176]
MGALLSFPPEAGDAELAAAHAAAASVCDPEVPVLTIEDLGVLRAVTRGEAGIEVTITPTYSGCPAMDMIALQVDLALEKAGITRRKVRLSLSPAWTTDWMSEAGKEKLRAYGIAPPVGKAKGRAALFGVEAVACPHCGLAETERVSEFGSTACKAHWRCLSCREPFDYFKCI